MYQTYGGDLPATVIRRVMAEALHGLEYRDFPGYQAEGQGPDFLSASASPSPTPSVSPTDVEETPEPEVSETPGELEPSPTFTPPDGQSYLLENTVEPSEPRSIGDGVPGPEPVVTPAPLPDDFSSQGGNNGGAGQIVEESSVAPPPQRVELPKPEME